MHAKDLDLYQTSLKMQDGWLGLVRVTSLLWGVYEKIKGQQIVEALTIIYTYKIISKYKMPFKVQTFG